MAGDTGQKEGIAQTHTNQLGDLPFIGPVKYQNTPSHYTAQPVQVAGMRRLIQAQFSPAYGHRLRRCSLPLDLLT